MRTEDAAPTGLEFVLVWDSTMMPRLTALGDAAKIAQPFMAGASFNPSNQVPAGTKENPVLAKDSAVPGRDFGRFRNVNPAINGWAIFKRIQIRRACGNDGRLHGG
jgi:hypothetical protein